MRKMFSAYLNYTTAQNAIVNEHKTMPITPFENNLTLHGISHKRRRRNQTTEKFFTCIICNYKTTKKDHFKAHEKIHTGEKPFNCRFCDYRTAHKYSLNRHERTHVGEKPFKCSFCNHKTLHKHHMTAHERIHTGEKPYNCSFCDYKSPVKDRLKVHERTHTREKPFLCTFCDHKTALKCSMKLHERTHTRAKLFHCIFCDHKTYQESHMKDHVTTHSKVKVFNCTCCDYKTYSKAFLEIHENIHTTEKSFKCSDYKSLSEIKLKEDVETQIEEKSLNCNYKTVDKKPLHVHEETHIAEKYFYSSFRDYKNSYKNNSKTHHENNYPEQKTFQYNLCDFKATSHPKLSHQKNYIHMKNTLLSNFNKQRGHKGEEECVKTNVFKCALCDYENTEKDVLVSHVTNHFTGNETIDILIQLT